MSTLVSSYPPLLNDPDYTPDIPTNAQWWRLRLQPNADGHYYVRRIDTRDDDWENAQWVSWEFFDGETTYLDAGLDKPNVYGVHIGEDRPYPSVLKVWMDLLCVGPPTPCPRWEALTKPGEHVHPEYPLEAKQ